MSLLKISDKDCRIWAEALFAAASPRKGLSSYQLIAILLFYEDALDLAEELGMKGPDINQAIDDLVMALCVG